MQLSGFYGNKETYETLRNGFYKHDALTAAIIDLINPLVGDMAGAFTEWRTPTAAKVATEHTTQILKQLKEKE